MQHRCLHWTVLAVTGDGVCLDLGTSRLSDSLSGSKQLFTRGVSAQREGCVGGHRLMRPGCRVDK